MFKGLILIKAHKSYSSLSCYAKKHWPSLGKDNISYIEEKKKANLKKGTGHVQTLQIPPY